MRATIHLVSNPQSISTFIVDGVVAGRWRFQGGHVLIEEFRPLSRGTRAHVREEADRITPLFTLTEDVVRLAEPAG